MYDEDVELRAYKEALEVELHLEAGAYTLELYDDYGDGGVVGEVVDLHKKRSSAEFTFASGTYMAIKFAVESERP